MRVYQFIDFETFFEAAEVAVKEKVFVSVHTPIHHEELETLLALRPTEVNLGHYAGGVLGFITGMLITIIPNVWTFPINVGGRPLFSWPAFAILTFELMVLFAAMGGILAFFWSQKYPRYDREIFALKEYHDKEKGEYFLVTNQELRGAGASHSYRLP